MSVNIELLSENARSLGIEITSEQVDKFRLLSSLLVENNKIMNLTAITLPDDIAVKHFADSISVFSAIDIEKNSKVLDLGTGAGFPGIPILIMRPDIKLTMLDSTAKKLNYVAETVEKLSLEAETLHSRAEDAGHDAQQREKYDVVCSRAVASLNVLCEYCMPFVKVGGTFVAMKGSKALSEIENAKKSLTILGGTITEIKSLTLSDSIERNLIIIKKTSQTPTKYPRPSAQISKKPL